MNQDHQAAENSSGRSDDATIAQGMDLTFSPIPINTRGSRGGPFDAPLPVLGDGAGQPFTDDASGVMVRDGRRQASTATATHAPPGPIMNDLSALLAELKKMTISVTSAIEGSHEKIVSGVVKAIGSTAPQPARAGQPVSPMESSGSTGSVPAPRGRSRNARSTSRGERHRIKSPNYLTINKNKIKECKEVAKSTLQSFKTLFKHINATRSQVSSIVNYSIRIPSLMSSITPCAEVITSLDVLRNELQVWITKVKVTVQQLNQEIEWWKHYRGVDSEEEVNLHLASLENYEKSLDDGLEIKMYGELKTRFLTAAGKVRACVSKEIMEKVLKACKFTALKDGAPSFDATPPSQTPAPVNDDDGEEEFHSIMEAEEKEEPPVRPNTRWEEEKKGPSIYNTSMSSSLGAQMEEHYESVQNRTIGGKSHAEQPLGRRCCGDNN